MTLSHMHEIVAAHTNAHICVLYRFIFSSDAEWQYNYYYLYECVFAKHFRGIVLNNKCEKQVEKSAREVEKCVYAWALNMHI